METFIRLLIKQGLNVEMAEIIDGFQRKVVAETEKTASLQDIKVTMNADEVATVLFALCAVYEDLLKGESNAEQGYAILDSADGTNRKDDHGHL